MSKKRRAGWREQTGRDSRAIENRQNAVAINVAPLERFFRQATREIGLSYPPAAVCLITDREMTRLNGTYRKKRRTTDVLSFPTEEQPRPKRLLEAAARLRGRFLGDIAISPTVARRNAKSIGRTMAGEIRILLLHGILHLMGYDHESDRGEMEREEAKLRRRLRLA